MDVLVHEMMHALGLSSTMYSSWLSQSSGTPYANGGTVASGSVGTYLTTPNSLSQAQQTLNCSSLTGLPLEEEGSRASALSHWEFRFFYQELMTPFLFALGVQRQRLSSVTTAALQDTGWYTPRVEYVMPLDVQQVPAMGCSLALNSCAAYQESFPDTYYCSPGSSGTQQQEAVGDPANLACYTNTDPATCDVTPFSDNCGLLHPANLPCSSSYLGSQLPPGSTNLLSALSSSSSFSAAQDFYVSFGAAYGPDAVCLPWRNSSGGDLSYSGCFLTSCTADGGTTPVISAIVNNAFVNLPCTPDTTLLLRDYLPVQDLSTTLQCPSLTTAQTICSQLSAAPDSCGNSGLPCVSGTCTDGGTCVCDLEYMGADCSIHVSQVTDFDDPSMMSPAVTPSPLIPPAHHPILFPPSPSPSRIITPPLNPYTKPASNAPPPKTRPAKLPKSPNNKPKPMSDNNAKNPKPSPSAAATPTANPSAKKASPTLVQKNNNKKSAVVVPAALGPALPVDMRASTPVESIMWSSSLSGGQQEGLSTIINSVVSLPSEVEHIPVDDALVGDEMADLSTGHYQQGKDSDMTAALNALSTLGSVNAVIGLAEEERTEK
ncbi:hypothetical protein CEUSTIGMA_g13324.t1 [Chlamydomonas eustigma]|uniref:EGF-like domain-containing protein n=1 Tax=Chlamydomonas eustigma TaxID=1157962 RepID=A0A250XS68_9CHLO|nr:hypothetical protein CEUSTIGMA_g13324.t1 [Chlamydomonas eustigma]|eukprot:GAX85908.1 hypothetical protein CEUSTIGMA_g13324.t1 [Chlamydomonas eustigma]